MTAPSLGPTFGLHSAGRVTGAGVLSNTVNLTNSVRNGAGDYTLTLGSQIDPTQRCPMAFQNGNSGGSVSVDFAGESDSIVTVKTFDELGLAADRDFSLCVFRTSVPS